MPDPPARVRVYWHSCLKRFSLVAGSSRPRVVLHPDRIVLEDARLVVNAGGRRRCLESGVKNVHAYATGRPVALDFDPGRPYGLPGRRLAYNPREHESFVHVDDGTAVRRAAYLTMTVEAGRAVLIAWDVALNPAPIRVTIP